MVFGQNGVINKAQEANENTKIEQVREQLELAKGPEYIEGNGKYNPDSYFERIEEEGIIGNKDTDVAKQEDGTYEVTTEEGYIFKITLVPSEDNAENIEIEYIGKADGPRIREVTVTNKTTNSISIEVETVNAEGGTYRYYYKKEGEADWIKADEVEENTYTFSGLEANIIYNIKVEVEKDGKVAERETSTITGELPEGAVQFSPIEWNNGEASTVITTSEEGYTLQYQKGGIAEGSWINTTSGTVISGLKHGERVYGRLYDGTNGSKTADIDVQDLEDPQDAVISLSETSTNTKGNVTATVTLLDNESGVNAGESKWVYNTTAGFIGTDESIYTGGTFTAASQQITLSATTVGTYYLHVLTVDYAGNKVETISKSISVTPATPQIVDLIQQGTILTENTEAEDSLGNIVTIPKGFKVTSDGKTVPEGIVIQDIDANQFVWIPVGTVKKSNGQSCTIELGRYTFSSTGTKTLVQSANSYSSTININFNGVNYQEVTQYRDGMNYTQNATAKNLSAFVNNTITNGGYYLARYEASYGSGSSVTDWKPLSQPSTSTRITSSTTLVRKMLWNDIYQADAAAASRNMYANNTTVGVESDLINSYAWDTAIVFIQEMGNTNYANLTSVNEDDIENTGSTGDRRCNIFDMASNIMEWTTEYSTNGQECCANRGGYYNESAYTARNRNSEKAGTWYSGTGFRVCLWIK